MGRALTVFFGLLAFGLLLWACLRHEPLLIQKEVAANANAALGEGGYAFARASADGQHITLRGTAPSRTARTAAAEAAASARGVVGVTNEIALLTDVPPPGPDSSPVLLEGTEGQSLADDVGAEENNQVEESSATAIGLQSKGDDLEAQASEPPAVVPLPERLVVEFDGLDRTLSLSGTALADDVSPNRIAQLRTEAAAALPSMTLSDELDVGANVSVGAVDAIRQILPLVSQAKRATLEIDAQQIQVNARFARFSQRAALQRALEGLSRQDTFVDRNLSWMLDSPSPTVERCQQAFDDLLGNDSIMFTINKADIRASSYALLDKLVGVASDCEVTVSIEGHTDSRGSDALNEALSKARADSVRAYLISKGVDGNRITTEGFGAARPIADNETVNGRQANRRIEFRVDRVEGTEQ